MFCPDFTDKVLSFLSAVTFKLSITSPPLRSTLPAALAISKVNVPAPLSWIFTD
jgi:hypothetical protein